jgi:hypothetical protein
MSRLINNKALLTVTLITILFFTLCEISFFVLGLQEIFVLQVFSTFQFSVLFFSFLGIIINVYLVLDIAKELIYKRWGLLIRRERNFERR